MEVTKMTLNSPAKPFLSDIEQLRRSAQEDIDKGAVTSAYGLDSSQVVDVLNRVLASEIVCVLRYKSHYYMAKGIHAEPVAAEFQEHARQEEAHAERVAIRITQLNGEPNLNPDGMIGRSASQYGPGTQTLIDMIKEDLIAERVVIMWYADLIRWLGEHDPTSRRLMEDLLAEEEDHAQDLADLLVNMDGPGLTGGGSSAGESPAKGPGGTQGLPGMRDAGASGVSDGLDGR
jgi:bacterioferritin